MTAERGAAPVRSEQRRIRAAEAPFSLSARLAAGVATVLGLGFAANEANAANSLSITYFEVKSGNLSPDFGGSGTPNVAAGSSLGANGFPVVSASSPGVSDYNAATHELEWWSPTLSGGAVVATGSSTVSLPYSNTTMYAPNSTGSSDASYFETAVLKGTLAVSTSGTVTFQLGSDDDSFLYIDGALVGQNPGIHGVTTASFTSGALAAGLHTVEVFYADREQVGAALSLSLTSTNAIVYAPEPASILVFGAGVSVLGAVRSRRRLPRPA